MQASLSFIGVEGSYYYWLGASDLYQEGEWTWINSKDPVGSFIWHSDEPGGGIESNCMLLDDPSHRAFDIPCSNGHYPLCQILI